LIGNVRTDIAQRVTGLTRGRDQAGAGYSSGLFVALLWDDGFPHDRGSHGDELSIVWLSA